MMANPLLPEMQLTEQQRLFGVSDHCKQSVLPPHDLVASLYEHPHIFFPIFTAEPGRLEHYWSQNTDLYESLGMPGLDIWPLFGGKLCSYFWDVLRAFHKYMIYICCLNHVCLQSNQPF